MTVALLGMLAVCASTADALDVPVTRTYTIGGDLLYNTRTGYFDFGDLAQKTSPPSLGLYGLTLGVRYEVQPWLRLQAAVSADMGGIDVDTLLSVPLDNGTTHNIAVSDDFVHVSMSPEVHYLLPAQQVMTPYLRAGLGIDYMNMREGGRVSDDGSNTPVKLPWDMNGSHFSLDLRGGVGLDFAVREGWGLFVEYAFTYWQPVRYSYIRDMPLSGVNHWESFRTHAVRLGIAWRAR